MGAICPVICSPCHAKISTKLFSNPGQWVHHFAQGNLETFVGGPIRGHLHEDGRHRVDTRWGHFPPVNLPWWLFAGVLSVTHYRKPFHLCCRVEDEALIGPQTSIPALDVLFSMLPSTPHHAARCPKKQCGHLPAQTPTVPAGLSNSAWTCLGFSPAWIVTPLRGWIKSQKAG